MYKKLKLAALLLAAVVLMGSGCPQDEAGLDVWAVNSSNVLMKFDMDDPSQIDYSVQITGLQNTEDIVAIDFRPETGTLYGLGSTNARGSSETIYTINTATGLATPVGVGLSFFFTGAHFGFDFDPVDDVIRVVTDNDENFRVDPTTGAVIDGDIIAPGIQFDTNLAPAGDVVAIAYTNPSATATVTTLFGLDSGSNNLVMIGGVDGTPSPNGGAVTTIGLTGVSLSDNTSFDISLGTAIVITQTPIDGVLNDVYSVDLSTGDATFRGTINGNTIVAMAIDL